LIEPSLQLDYLGLEIRVLWLLRGKLGVVVVKKIIALENKRRKDSVDLYRLVVERNLCLIVIAKEYDVWDL
jgi:hypothetical protein